MTIFSKRGAISKDREIVNIVSTFRNTIIDDIIADKNLGKGRHSVLELATSVWHSNH